MAENMMWVCIYLDTVPEWPRDENGEPAGGTNLADIPVPESILREWYREVVSAAVPDFAAWLADLTADDTDGLYSYAARRGYKPDYICPF